MTPLPTSLCTFHNTKPQPFSPLSTTAMSTTMQAQRETQFKETRTLTLKLSPPPEKTHTRIDPKNCWNFLETSTQPSPKFTPYVPPRTNNKSLSYVTLDLCTENLGSETGSDMSDDIDILSLPPPVSDLKCNGSNVEQPKPMRKKVSVPPRSFPPPLTTIRGINPIRVRSKREGGRLVIDAVEERSVVCNYFRSDRSHGRLRLSFWDDCSTTTTSAATADQETEVEEDQETEMEGAAAETAEAGQMPVNVNVVREDMIGNNLEVGVEIGTQKFQRPSRCMEGNNSKGLCWEPLWVAT